MRFYFQLFLTSILILVSCQKEKISIGTEISDSFYVENAGASMRVLVEGNSTGKVFIVFVHGGPGSGSLIYETDYIRNNLEDKYAVVYWDQRNAGASQGGSNGGHLTLLQMTDDLKKVLQVIKARYGPSSKIFLLGHSYGGLLTSSFLTTGNNQSMVKGWISANGSHNYPLNDSLTREMLLRVGKQQIDSGINSTKWEKIVSYCTLHISGFSQEESEQFSKYGAEAETLFEEVIKIDEWKIFENNALRYKWPLTSMLVNFLYSSEAGINKELAKTEFSSSVYKITVPVLILFGQYDFICPKGLGDDLYSRINSSDKKIVISPVSGHSIMFQDEVLFCREIDEFIRRVTMRE
jgi:pimeloyl-ACP methyl ester carboxylesterase